MPHEVIMPALGMAQDTGLIVAWHKSPGDKIAEGDVLFEVETDKATMEVEAQASGFLTQVRAGAGDEVPVGKVIAAISDKAEEDAPKAPAGAPAPAESDALPEGRTVIMPALGMAQDTGLIVAWHKAAGDAVSASDILFEVETDKSTVEVEAGFDGYVAALLAEPGEEAPVGETIAVISTEKPSRTVQRSRAASASAEPAAAPATAEAPERTAEPESTAPKKKPSVAPAPRPQGAVRSDGRILASPKTRRLALEQGLDLNLLVDAGHPQPYHVRDLEVLKALPQKAGVAAPASTRRLTAELPVDGFADFAAWASEHSGLSDANALLAGLAAAGLKRDNSIVAVESFGETMFYSVPAGPLGAVSDADPDATPDLRLRDLRMSRISTVALGAEDAPVLTLTKAGDDLLITLECASQQMSAADAVALLSNFAGRMEQPLRHLL